MTNPKALSDDQILDIYQSGIAPRCYEAGRELSRRIRLGIWTLGG